MVLAAVLGFVTVLAVTLGFSVCRAVVAVFTFCFAVAFVAGLVVAGRAVEVAGLVAVVGFTVRLVAELLAGFAVVFVVAGRVVVVEVEGLAVVVVGRAWVEGVRLMFC